MVDGLPIVFVLAIMSRIPTRVEPLVGTGGKIQPERCSTGKLFDNVELPLETLTHGQRLCSHRSNDLFTSL